ncbi:MAG: response regulator transcription factor [Variovorax sp.]|nr:response regulator transcription factor [Variovorax sp.]
MVPGAKKCNLAPLEGRGARPVPLTPEVTVEDILIVDDDQAVRERLERVAAAAAPRARCAMAGSLAEARQRLASHRYDLALLDVGLPDGSGLDLLPWMQAHAPEVDAVVVSSLGDDATVLQAIRGGAVGYLLKNGSDVELELSLGSMERGGAPIDPVIARRILKLMTAPPALSPGLATISPTPVPAATAELSEREMDVLRLVAQGHSNREIAQSLTLSINTVECHAKNIYRKLAVRSRSGAVYSARTKGLLP